MEQLTSVYERIGEAIGESLESVCSMPEEERRELIITLGLEDTVSRIEDRAKGQIKEDPDPGKQTVIQRIAAAIGETVENVTNLPGAERRQLVEVLGLEELAAQEDEEHVDSGGGGSAVIDVADLSSDDSATGPSCSTGAGWGECPVCGQLLPRDKLGLHAMACQGLEGNGGEGLEVNPMEVQSKCGKCGCLVPDLVMEEHSRTCWADNSNKRRIETPMERRRSKYPKTNFWASAPRK